jgi:hypothetical protein
MLMPLGFASLYPTYNSTHKIFKYTRLLFRWRSRSPGASILMVLGFALALPNLLGKYGLIQQLSSFDVLSIALC